MKYATQWATFQSSAIAAIQAAVDEELELSRRALSRRVCEWLDWGGPNGKFNEASCRETLLRLHRNGFVHLPEAATPSALQHPSRSGIAEPPELADVTARLKNIGTVQFFDRRLTERLTDLARDFFAQPGSLITEACDGSKAKIKAAYRFFDNS